MPYPTSTDVSAKLVELGYTAPSNIAAICASVIAEFERRTGYKPFLGSETEASYTFDPPYKMRDFELDFQGGFWEVSSIEIDEIAVDSDRYDLLPLNAAQLDRGWNKVRFRFHPGFKGASVVITGKRGYAEDLPDDVYSVLFDEMVERAKEEAPSSTADLAEVRQGPVTLKFKDGKAALRDKVAHAFKNRIRQYQRI